MRNIPILCFLTAFFIFGAADPGLAVQKNQGKASWYGTSAHGKKTANGEIFNRKDLTTAHRTLPFGTVLRVYNVKNEKHVLVAVTDRGPFSPTRILDLSKEAARRLHLVRAGVGAVAFEVVSDEQGRSLNPKHGFYVRLNEGHDPQEAHALSTVLELRLGLDILAMQTDDDGLAKYALCVGPYASFQEARIAFTQIQKQVEPFDIIEAPLRGAAVPHFAPPVQRQPSPAVVEPLQPKKKAPAKRLAKKQGSVRSRVSLNP